jgi:uncharacterized membrane protein
MLLGLIWLLNLVAVFGYAVFARNPEMLNLHPLFPVIFGQSYQFFSRISVALAFCAVVAELTRQIRFQWILPLLLVCLISAGAELLGTSTGLPFGPYEYTDLLGPKIAGLVPYLIPLSWFTMAIPSYLIIRKIYQRNGAGWSWFRITLSSLVLVHWDLTLDPAMSQLTPFWIWGTTGPYYGTPILNLVGWFVVSLFIMASLEWSIGSKRFSNIRWHWNFYLANLVLPFGICLAAGLWFAVGMSSVFMAALFWAARYHSPKQRHRVDISMPEAPKLQTSR